jgi:DNA polymerase-1
MVSYLEKPVLQDAYKLFHQGILALARAERQGICVDVEYIKRKKIEITKEIEEEEKKLKNTTFYQDWRQSRDGQEPNYQSHQQLKEFLYKEKKLAPVKYTPKGKKELAETGSSDQGSTDAEALSRFKLNGLDKIIYIKKLKKVRDTNLKTIEEEMVDGKIHPFFNLHTVRTYRGSSSYPNSQNLPKREELIAKIVRSAIIPRKGHMLMEVDFKALEVAAGACVHRDPNMIKYLKSGEDMHKDITKKLFFLSEEDAKLKGFSYLRSCVKNAFVFPQFYGSNYKANAKDVCKWTELSIENFRSGTGIKIDGEHISDHFRKNGIKNLFDLMWHLKEREKDLWSNRFPVYGAWKRKIWEQYQKDGYIDTLTGFRCGGILRDKDTFNYPIQSIAFHILLKSLIFVDAKMVKENWKTRIIGQIHDSLFLDVHPNELDYIVDTVRQITTNRVPREWKWIIVPLQVEFSKSQVDGSWFEMESF